MVCQIKQTLRELKKMFKETFKSIDKQTIQRKRKVFSNHTLYTLLFMSANNCGYQEALLNMKIQNMIGKDVSHQAINNKILSGKFSEEFFSMNDQIIEKFFKGKSGRRIFGVDGSKANLSCSTNKNGFRKVESNKYCQGLLTLIYDIQHQIPMAYKLTQTTNERVAFYDLVMKIDNNCVRNKY